MSNNTQRIDDLLEEITHDRISEITNGFTTVVDSFVDRGALEDFPKEDRKNPLIRRQHCMRWIVLNLVDGAEVVADPENDQKYRFVLGQRSKVAQFEPVESTEIASLPVVPNSSDPKQAIRPLLERIIAIYEQMRAR